MYNKAKHKDKNTFYMNCLQPFNGEQTLANHCVVCLENNDFLFYVDLEGNLKNA